MQQIESGQWGETPFLPVLVQALNVLVSNFSGLAVMMPDHNLSSTPVFIVYHPDGQHEQVSSLPSGLPLLIFDGVNHWTFAEPDQGNNLISHRAIGRYGKKAVIPLFFLMMFNSGI